MSDPCFWQSDLVTLFADSQIRLLSRSSSSSAFSIILGFYLAQNSSIDSGKGSEVTDTSTFNVYSQFIPRRGESLSRPFKSQNNPSSARTTSSPQPFSTNGEDIREDIHRSFCEPNQPSAPAIVLLNADKQAILTDALYSRKNGRTKRIRTNHGYW
jgi:hypothetical protein